MKLIIDPTLFKQYPDVLLGVVVLQNINNVGHDEAITQLLRDAEKEAIQKVGTIPVAEHPHIAPWREAYRTFGAKPKDYPSSIENLIRRISKGEQIRHINKLVDIYNVISLRYLLPVGGEDCDAIQGDVHLTIAGPDEKAILLLGEKEPRPPYVNEVIYKDDNGAICRRWNWKESDRTKLTEGTTNAFMVLEALPPVDRPSLEKALFELKNLLQKYCGGEITTTILDINNKETDIQPNG